MKKMLCLEDAISVIVKDDIIFKNTFYYIREHDEELTHNNVCVYEVFDAAAYYIGIFPITIFIDLAKYRENQINEILL